MQDLIALLEKISDTKILCVGDIMLDEFVTGTVDRISPEAPIPVLHATHISRMPGGMGNVAANIASLGGLPKLATVIGDDAAGQSLKIMAEQHMNVELSDVEAGFVVEENRPTTLKIRYIAESQQLLRADHEVKSELDLTTYSELWSFIEVQLEYVDAVILSDYGKGVLAEDLCQKIIQKARLLGKPIVVDPKGHDYRPYRGATIVTPNRKELSQATGGGRIFTDEEVLAAGQKLITECGVENVCATRSEQGMSLISKAGAIHNLPAHALEVYDVSGAGDTVVASLAACLGAGATLEQAIKIANYAAGIVVGKVGTAKVRITEIIDAMRQAEGWSGDALAIQSEDQIIEQVERWRRRGYKIGFTNGVFDVLHPGHVHLLNQIRQKCDRLIVGINSDVSIQSLKDRVVNNSQDARARMLVALASVDRVVPYDQETPVGLLKELRPDLLAKGQDYSEQEVIGADIVKAYGGEIFLAEIGEKNV